MFFFQDTNAFALRTLLPALGSAASRNLDVCSTCVERRAGEAMGALCLLKKDTISLLKNVEYNQLEPLLLSTTGKGDVDNPSPYPGNTNQLIITLVENTAMSPRWRELAVMYQNLLTRNSTQIEPSRNPLV